MIVSDKFLRNGIVWMKFWRTQNAKLTRNSRIDGEMRYKVVETESAVGKCKQTEITWACPLVPYVVSKFRKIRYSNTRYRVHGDTAEIIIN